MKKRAIIATLVGVGLVSVLVAGKPTFDSEGDYGYHKCMHDKHMKHHDKEAREPDRLFKQIRAELDLTTAQKKQIKSIFVKQKEMMKNERQAMRNKRFMPDASQFMTAEKFDKEAFKKVMKEQRDQKEQRIQEKAENRLNQRADTLEKIFAILTPEQRTKFIALSQKKSS